MAPTQQRRLLAALLLLLAATSTCCYSAAAASSATSAPTLRLIKEIDAAGYHDYSLLLLSWLMNGAVSVDINSPMTLLIPGDQQLTPHLARYEVPTLLRMHMISSHLKHHRLSGFPSGTVIPSMYDGFSMLITKSAIDGQLRLNNVTVEKSDFCSGRFVACHGISDMLQWAARPACYNCSVASGGSKNAGVHDGPRF